MIRTWLTRSKERTCNPAGRPSRDEKDTDLKNSRDDWEWYFYLVLYCITGHKLILHQKSARAKICVKLQLRMKHGLSLNDVADICGIDVGYVARMELGVPVKLYYARRLRRCLAAHLDVPLTEAVLPVVLIGDEGGSNIQIGMREEWV